VPELRGQATCGKRDMPTLPQSLRRPHPWLFGVAVAAGLLVADACRSPERQLTAKAYVELVNVYQWAKPQMGFTGGCRFVPTCSQYSEEAVRRHGLFRGLKLTRERVNRCQTSVVRGTRDPVPTAVNEGSR
jgi:putative membrane protein insertion efficiency factor